MTNVDRITQILQCSGVLLPNDYTPTWDYNRKINELAAKIDAELHPVIETVEQLDALPDFSVVHDRVNTVWEKEWHCGEGPWWQTSSDLPRSNEDFWLPARVLYTPEADR